MDFAITQALFPMSVGRPIEHVGYTRGGRGSLARLSRYALTLLSLLVCVGFTPVGRGAEQARPPIPSLVPVQDQKGLPRVLLIGDSISMGYTLEVRAALTGVANVHRPPTNCNSTGFGLAHLGQWLGAEPWDVIHFNFGLHDAKLPPEGNRHAPPQVYEENLRTLVRRLKATRARLIWATTTPVPLGGELAPNRRFGDIKIYNDIALRVMKENGVAINDLYSAIAPHVARTQIHRDVHFLPEGYGILAGETARAISEQLARVAKRGQ